MAIPIQEEPESTVGRKPTRWPRTPEHERAEPAVRAEEPADRSARDEPERERGEPPTVRHPGPMTGPG